MERPDFEVSAEEYAELLDGENAAASAKIQTQTEIVGDVTVREFRARSWFGGQARVDVTPQQIAGHLPQRTRLTVYNVGTEAAYLAASRESCTYSSAALLPVGGLPMVFEHTASVYAIGGDTAAGSTVLSILAEFRDGGE